LDDLQDRVNELPKDLELVVYCRSGNRSAEAARILLAAGFSDVYSMDGGLNDWIMAGYEVDP
jgi:rhodanese-related sulfurtransferase